MNIFLRIVAMIFSGIIFLGYGWWNRDYLSLIEKIFMLSPAYGLLIIAVIPYRVLALKKLRILITLILIAGIAQSLQEIESDIRSPIEPDLPAAMLRLIIIAILGVGIYKAWKPKSESTESKRSASN